MNLRFVSRCNCRACEGLGPPEPPAWLVGAEEEAGRCIERITEILEEYGLNPEWPGLHWALERIQTILIEDRRERVEEYV